LDASNVTISSPGDTARPAVLFDWDGTIVDSVPALFDTDAAIARELGLPFDRAIFKRTFSPNWRRMYRALGIADDQVEVAVAVWAATFHSGETVPFAGVQRALIRLARDGYRLGIVTGGSRPEIEPQLGRLGLAEVLNVSVFGDDSVDGKPDAAPLLLALERAGGVLPSNAIYVESMLADAGELLAAGATETAASVADWVDRFLGPEASER
jgi:beta-phosphoglucomutase-like phosphatase (HAD superfamily)